MTLERIDPQAAIDPDRLTRRSKLAVNLRVGQQLVLKTCDGQAIQVVLEAKHGYGARLVVLAHRSVEIVTPDT